MNEKVPGSRGGSSYDARVASESGSISRSVAPTGETHTVTMRPRLSKVTEAHSAANRVLVTSGSRPSGPATL